jgi:phage terminase small subunit
MAKRKLTAKQQRFTEEYLRDFNATQAAIRAGYSARTAGKIGSQLLGKTGIAEAIARGRDRATAKAEVTVDRIVQAAAAVAFSDIRQLYDERGELLPVHQWPDGVAESVAGIEVEERFEGRGEAREYVGQLRKVKRWDKTKALEILAKYKKLFDDGAKINLTAGVVVYLPSNGREPG